MTPPSKNRQLSAISSPTTRIDADQLERLFFIVSNVVWVDKFKEMKISFVMCTIDLVGQGHLTTILTISISVIRGARKVIIFCFPCFGVDKVNEIKISFVSCTADLVGQYGGQGTLTNEVNGAHDNTNFYFIELVYRKNVGNKK